MNNNGELKLIILESAKKLGEQIESNIQYERGEYSKRFHIKIKESFFSSGESKAEILETIRGADVYIICDVGNYGIEYNIRGNLNHCSPYDNYKKVKDVIGAMSGDANKITVVMPLLIDSRQHKRNGREPLACPQYLQELTHIGVDRIITVDVHDRTVASATPYTGFNNIMPSSTILKEFLLRERNNIDMRNLLVISPDQGAVTRTQQIADQLGVPMGTFSKARDLTKVVNGKSPITAHRYLGPELKGKDLLIPDDIISSGDSMLDIALKAKEQGAGNVYFMASFALFTEGIDRFREAFNNNLFEMIYTTNVTYVDPKILKEPWIHEVDCSSVIAKVISDINLNKSIGDILTQAEGPLEGHIYPSNGNGRVYIKDK